jgi:hypothetical protein
MPNPLLSQVIYEKQGVTDRYEAANILRYYHVDHLIIMGMRFFGFFHLQKNCIQLECSFLFSSSNNWFYAFVIL